jgi:hypothetical protein
MDRLSAPSYLDIRVYEMPEGVELDKIAWNLAASRLTPDTTE